jgi:hypothetical protein
VKCFIYTNNGSGLSKSILTIFNLNGEAGEIMGSAFKHGDGNTFYLPDLLLNSQS